MNVEKLRKLAQEISRIVGEYDVDYELIAVNITVSPQYFEKVKDNLQLSTSISSPHTCHEVGDNWLIQLVRSDRKNQLN